MSTTKLILGTTVYGEASGNYDGSSLDWQSDAQQAADYYRGYGGLQTITFSLTGFQGLCILEATLDPDADTAIWFETYRIGDLFAPMTDYHPESVTGNFTWMRVRVEGFEAGIINSVNITY